MINKFKRSKNLVKDFTFLKGILISMILITSCSKDNYDSFTNDHKGIDKNKINFSQFKNETAINKFDPILQIKTSNALDNKSKVMLSDFVIDTLAIKKIVSQNQNTTYTFRIYPLFKKNNENEYYNLVYRKVDGNWVKTVFLLNKKNTQNKEEIRFETIEKIGLDEKVISKNQKTAQLCYQYYYEVRCNGSCDGPCDGFACPTGECLSLSVSVGSCGGGGGGSGTTSPINTGSPGYGGGGSSEGLIYEFVFSPNTFSDLNLDDPNFINEWQKSNVWAHLSGPMKAFFTATPERMDFFNQTIQYQIYNNWSPESKEFANLSLLFKYDNPDVTYNDIIYNRTVLDVNSAKDIDNNVEGGYDSNSYVDFNPQQTWSTISPVISTNQFVGWGTQGIKRNCMDYAKAQIAKNGYQISNYGAAGQTFQIYTEQNGVNHTSLAKGLSYLRYALSNNIPVIVGVDDNPGHPGNPDNSTDHFVVIVGMGNNSNGNYFQFYDNASGNISQGTSSLNLLYYNSSTGKITGKSQCIGYFSTVAHDYVITQIRKSKTK